MSTSFSSSARYASSVHHKNTCMYARTHTHTHARSDGLRALPGRVCVSQVSIRSDILHHHHHHHHHHLCIPICIHDMGGVGELGWLHHASSRLHCWCPVFRWELFPAALRLSPHRKTTCTVCRLRMKNRKGRLLTRDEIEPPLTNTHTHPPHTPFVSSV